MDTFDIHYDVKMNYLVVPEYHKNKFIDGQMVYSIYGDYK